MTWRATTAPWAAATSAVPSREPSSTTSTAVYEAADLGGDAVQDGADVVGLVVGGDEDADLVAEVVRIAGDAELLPGEALEHPGELARDPRSLAQRPEHEQEEDQDREHGDAHDPGAVRALEREGRQQGVGDLGGGDDQDPGRDQQQDEDVGVAQLTPAPDRIAADQQRHDDPDGADRGQLGGQDVGRQRHLGRPRIGAAVAWASRPKAPETEVVARSRGRERYPRALCGS